MKQLEEAGISIGDFAMSLVESGKVGNKSHTPEVARPKELPVTDLDISNIKVSSSMMDKVLQESFGVDKEVPEKVQEPQLSEQEILQERIVTLKGELVETINKLTELVSEMAGMGMTTTQSIGTGSSVNRTGKYRGRNKRTKKIRRR
tara:strand:- start:64 stop:504 length:441 start_codon:yes stop_codon:yes gene_type:complete